MSHTAEKSTALYDEHVRLGARVIPFGGWRMPVQYSGIVQEHHAVRNAVGMFDISHMGQFTAEGSGAAAWLNRMLTNNVDKLEAGSGQYTLLLNDKGGIIDDLIIYRVGPERFFLVVNASRTEEDFAWLDRHRPSEVSLHNRSDQYGGVAIQGPKTEELFEKLLAGPGKLPARNQILDTEINGVPVSIARTGYTGEDGVEVFFPAKQAATFWNHVLDVGKPLGLVPCGLGARDTLRLEGKLSLYGNDLTDDTTPLEADLGWVVKLDGADFIGKEALLKQRAEGVKRRLVGFEMTERGIARHGYAIHGGTGERVGEVTSGGPAPTLEKNIGMGYVPSGMTEPGTRLQIDCRGKMVAAQIVKGPFYKRGK
jgi:aminomethyltransferase